MFFPKSWSGRELPSFSVVLQVFCLSLVLTDALLSYYFGVHKNFVNYCSAILTLLRSVLSNISRVTKLALKIFPTVVIVAPIPKTFSDG